ncbi:MAG TPA: family 16 glycoside hydrolase [Chloroflexia bacterium]|nr:family 16 glycoside hydrolase [Chloroflexia bacterium]
MFNKKLVFVVALLLVAAVVAVGANQVSGVKVPPGNIVDSPNASYTGEVKPNQVPGAPELPAPAASSNVLFNESFNSDSLDAWRSLDDTTTATWQAKEGRLNQMGDARGESADEDAILLAKDVTFDNGVVEASLYNTSGAPIGILFRGSDAGYYRLTLHGKTPGNNSKLLLQKFTPSGVQDLASAPVTTWPGYTLGKWNQVAVTATGAEISVSIDGTQLLTANDSTLSSGWVGVWSFADMSARFDNVRIQHTAGR